MPTYTKPELTRKQRANLRKLATYLEQLPKGYKDFDMSSYFTLRERPYSIHAPSLLYPTSRSRKAVYPCGSVACAVGHGPAAGVKPTGVWSSWWGYACKAFGAAGGDQSVYAWLFSTAWAGVDNTPHGAAKRIRIVLEHGVPDNWSEQEDGLVPLCYDLEETLA